MATETVWLLEPAAAPDDGVWQGRALAGLAVRASSAAFARIVADKWAAKSGSWGSRRPGFEDQLLYHVREAPRDIVLPESGVIVIEGPVASIGPQNERPGGVKGVRTSPEGKTTTTDFPGGDFPGESR